MGWKGLDGHTSRVNDSRTESRKKKGERNSCKLVIFVRSYAKTRSQIDVNKKEAGQRESIM